MPCHSSSSTPSNPSDSGAFAYPSHNRKPSHDLGRRQSRTSSNRHQNTMHMPVPPSLLQSPLLNSPNSIFQRVISPHTPTAEDEQWLQDTVPATPTMGRKASMDSTTSSSCSLSRGSSLSEQQALRRAAELRTTSPPALPSPPLIHVRRHEA
ncbi:uncharacterized protein EV420DRAFT_1641743 [Desarmillaria tabescens]|uniref:Uncharacterized protein n=1 Tax=Armillaria tabescens TaxID=1929756 RepID=A0AA39KGX7_ARMTA|nr:uncharacterized protein EV420DRAFT_1641743 [Desarmillaria tabescens]KAK0459534.1 hypothetical protein EV420DRAFT_1641743 [Desarmillaria tabescens]